jgi:hypothetical protein
MANNQITDARTLLDAADATTNFVGSTSPSQDTEIFIEGTASVAEQLTSSLRWVMYDAGAAQDWSNNVFYIWVNCGVVGLLDIKSLGGFRIRFAGPTTTDFFEVYVGGSDSWPISIAGGWTLFAVDIEVAAANPSNTGGTPPLTTAIQHVGWAGISSVMTRAADNTWMDALYRLPKGEPGILIEGQNQGVSPFRPWNTQDIFDTLGTAVGTFVPVAGGGFKVAAPIALGTEGASPAGTHQFTDANALLLWDSQEFIDAGFYEIQIKQDVGHTTQFNFSGGVIAAPSADGDKSRFAVTTPLGDVNQLIFNGTTLIHSSDLQFDVNGVSVDNCTLSDAKIIRVDTKTDSYSGNSHVDPATVTGEALIKTDRLGNIVDCQFTAGAGGGHAVETWGGQTVFADDFQKGPGEVDGTEIFQHLASFDPDKLGWQDNNNSPTEFMYPTAPAGSDATIHVLGSWASPPENILRLDGPRFQAFGYDAGAGTGLVTDFIADFVFSKLGVADNIFFMFRRSDLDNQVVVEFNNDSPTGRIDVIEYVAGVKVTSPVTVTGTFNTDLAADVKYRARIQMSGDTLTIWAGEDPGAGGGSPNTLDQILTTTITSSPAAGSIMGFGALTNTPGAVIHDVTLRATTATIDDTSVGNLFTGYGGSPIGTNLVPLSGSEDSAIFNRARESGVINVSGGGDTPSVRNGYGTDTTVNNNLSVTLTGLVEGTEVTVCLAGTQTTVAEIENVASPTDYTFSVGNGVAVDVIMHAVNYEHIRLENLVFTADTTLPITQRFDRNYSNPPN